MSEQTPEDQQVAGQPDTPSDAAKQAAKEDADWRAENPDKPRVRDAKEGVGGESFDYLDQVSG